jgi:signal transduction histidine kinase
MARINARATAWAIVAAVATSQVAWAGFLWANLGRVPDALADQLPLHLESMLLVSAIPVVGALIVSRLPRHPVGWLLLITSGSAVIDAAARIYATDGLYLHPDTLPGPEYAAWIAEWSWFPAMVTMLTFVPLYFPDGRLPSSRWRPYAIGLGVWLALTTVGYALYPTEPIDFPDAEPVVGVPAAIVLAVGMLATPLAVLVSFASVVVRRRRAVGIEREQLRWFLYACSVAVVGWTLLFLPWPSENGFGWLGVVLSHGPVLLLLAAIAIAILRYRLYDIDLVINRTLVFSALTAAAIGVYALVVVSISHLTTAGRVEWRGSLMVVALVAIAAYPLREWLQKRVNRLMYGDRDDPARAMSELARRVSDSLTPAALLPAIAETIGRALRLPYVAVELPAGDAEISFGSGSGPVERFDLVHQGGSVGTLLVGQRADNEPFSAGDRRVLEDLARQVAAAAHAVLLSRDLQESRERLVLAREEERRRLRRDLHDGVGSALAGLALQAGNARKALPDSPEEAERWIRPLEDGIRATVADVRRVVDDLRPPALDELGLAGALSQRASTISPSAVVTAELDDTPLPAALEVAAYRIAAEALANVARHTEAGHVTVSLDGRSSTGLLRLEVSDDGPGLPAQLTPGVGLRSMRERAEEVGGRCEIRSASGGGTFVYAELPVPPPAEVSP